MKKLRKRRIAKQYGVKYRRRNIRNVIVHYFQRENKEVALTFCNNATFLRLLKYKKQWSSLGFEVKKNERWDNLGCEVID